MSILNEKPKNTKLDFNHLHLKDIEYFTASKNIDRSVMHGLKMDFDEAVADEMEKSVKFYFVCTKKRQYDMIASPRFNEWLKKQDANYYNETTGEISEEVLKLSENPSAKANACMTHFISFLIAEHKKALKDGDKKIAQIPGINREKNIKIN